MQALRVSLAGLEGVEARLTCCLQENRQLYNMVQDLRGAIRVFCRIRPPGATGDLTPSCVDVGIEGDLAVYDLHRGGEHSQFRVDRVFDVASTQEEVYADVQPLIRSVLDGATCGCRVVLCCADASDAAVLR